MPINYHQWNLITPELDVDGNAVTHWPMFKNSKYLAVQENGVELFVPTNGASTANSDRTRTEFREIVPYTTTLKNWKYNDYPHQFLRVACTPSEVTPNGRVCVSQIHVKYNTRPLLKMVWDNGNLKVKFRPTYNMEQDESYTLITGLTLGMRVSYSIHVVANGSISINALGNGLVGSKILQLDNSWNDRLLYFKCGLYTQEDQNPLYTQEIGSRAVFDKIEIERY